MLNLNTLKALSLRGSFKINLTKLTYVVIEKYACDLDSICEKHLFLILPVKLHLSFQNSCNNKAHLGNGHDTLLCDNNHMA